KPHRMTSSPPLRFGEGVGGGVTHSLSGHRELQTMTTGTPQDAPATRTGSEVRPPTTFAWSPLRRQLFRSLWIASLVSNVGTWMQNVGAAWLMTDLAASPLTVALVQAATNLPFFVLAVPAGALADIVDRRRLLLVAQSWMLLVAVALAVVT